MLPVSIKHISSAKEEERVISTCSVCKKPLLLIEESIYIVTLGHMHKSCVGEGFAKNAHAHNKVKILFVDNTKRNYLLWEKTKDARDLYPELEFDIFFGGVDECEEHLKQHKVYDFVFLDAPSPDKMNGIINILKERDKKLQPRIVVFYGMILEAEKLPIGRFKTELELKGMEVKVMKLFELNFTKIKEISSSHIGKGEEVVKLYD